MEWGGFRDGSGRPGNYQDPDTGANLPTKRIRIPDCIPEGEVKRFIEEWLRKHSQNKTDA